MAASAGNSINSLSASFSRTPRGEVRSNGLEMVLPVTTQGITPPSDFAPLMGPPQDYPQISIDSTSSLIRHPSIVSRGSHASASIHDSGLELAPPRTHHQRNRSDVSAASLISYSGSDVLPGDGGADEPVVFVDTPPKNLLCMICEKVFVDPVIAKCGHTFCRCCVLNMQSGDCCPVHKVQLSKTGVISNLAVIEQISDLTIRCRHGCRPVAGTPGQYEVDPAGCPKGVKLSERKQHESTCEYAHVRCPNSSLCPWVRRKDLEAHKAVCERVPCPHKQRGCKFYGTRAATDDHIRECRYESIKGLLVENDQRIERMTQSLESKEQEIAFLRSMLVKLSEKVERLETHVMSRLDVADENINRVSAEARENTRSVQEAQRELGTVQAKLGLVDDYELLSATHMFKCKGTFVGHQGPVWALAVHGDSLFSGSSDETIKVWDTAANFKCKKTLSGHRGIVHTLCVHNHTLYSGSSDCAINVWDIDTLQLVTTLEGHDNPVCTLAVAEGLLLSGSLKVVKIWDTHTHKCIGQLTGLNHWVRALVTTESFVYAGSYQSISVWASRRVELEMAEKQQPKKLHVLHTSGGSVYSLCVTDKLVICGTYENLIHVWDLTTYTEVYTLDGHIGTVYALAVMAGSNGKGRLFSASYDRTIKVWNLDQFQCVQTLTRHQNSVDTLAVQKGRLFSGAADSTIKVWQ